MVAALVLAARLLLAAVVAVAGAAKLADRVGSRRAALDFGAPSWSAGVVAAVVPVAELVVAGLLLPARTAPAGAAGALVLLTVFSIAIAINLARRRTPNCRCFGRLHSSPTGWQTVARNAALAALAAFALVGTLAGRETSAVAWIGRLGRTDVLVLGAAVAVTVVVALGAVAFVSLLRSYGRVLLRLELAESALSDAGLVIEPEQDPVPEIGLAPGSPIPPFAEIEELLTKGLPLLLLFTSPSCGPCKALLPDVAAWQREHADSLIIAFASDGTLADIRAEVAEFELEHVLVDADLRLYRAFEANGTPSAVLIAPDGRIDSWVAAGRDRIEELLARAVEEPSEQPGLSVGAPTPALELVSLDGEPATLTDFEGRDTLLLFWNAGCGFCRALLPDLLAWERSTNGTGPRLVVVSSGDADSTRADGFASTVLLDASFAAGDAFGADGTPMAVLVDADGRVGSPVVAGADDVLSLARNGHD